MLNKIDGRTVFVAGATRGIGLEYVKQLAAKGCMVLASHRGTEVPKELSKVIDQYGKQVTPVELDVGDERSIEAAAAKVAGLGVKLDCLINNAGITGDQGAKVGLEQITAENMLKVFTVNTLGQLLVSKHFLKLLKKDANPPSVIANMSTKVSSIDDNTSGGMYAYRTSKSALNMLSKSMSLELQPQGIAVVLLHPGYVRTDLTGGLGDIDVEESVSGLIEEIEKTTLSNFRMVGYNHKIIPW